MKIRYLGHSCFECTDKNGRVLITDPYTKVGYELPKGLRADVVTVSHGHFDHNYFSAIQTEKVITEGAPCTIKGVEIFGVDSFHDEKQGELRGKNVIFVFKMDGLTVCHLGDIGEKVSQSLVEKIGKVDVLLLPVGGTYTIDAFGAKEYADAIQPKIVIPMHYKPLDGRIDIADIQPFLRLVKGEYSFVCGGETEINFGDTGIVYMERVRI